MSRWSAFLCGLVVAGAGFAAEAQTEGPPASLNALDEAIRRQGLDSCDAPAQTIADQILLLHTQLMVTGLACADTFADPGLYDRYREFTARNAGVLAPAEEEIRRRLGDVAFDAYRTEIANVESEEASGQSTLRYCRIRESRFNTLIGAAPEQFRNYADDLARRARVRHQSNCR